MAAPTFFWVEETDRSIYKLFYSGHYEIQDGHHIGPNLVNISPALRDSKMISKCVCVAPYYVRPDLKSKVVPRLGEIHVAMAALRAIWKTLEFMTLGCRLTCMVLQPQDKF